MMRTLTRALAAGAAAASLAAAVAMTPVPATAQEARPNAVPTAPVTREGWWIRINPANTAENVSWRFGAVRNKLGNPLRWWKDEQQSEFDLPPADRTHHVLHLAGIGLPYKDQVSFCLFFQDHGVALVEFAGERVLQAEQHQREPACVPGPNLAPEQ